MIKKLLSKELEFFKKNEEEEEREERERGKFY